MKTIALPGWAYDSLARQIAATDVDIDDYEWSGRAGFEASVMLYAGDKEYEVEIGGTLAVEVEDTSFTHDFGTEECRECRTMGIDSIDYAKATDDDGREYECLFDEQLLMKKARALC